ncbi:MAG: hypothetical protein ACFE7R_01175, partial [Candidatus Hodarchaeota archaeon]
QDVLKRVLKALPSKDISALVCDKNEQPGIVENSLEELDYINLILLRLMEDRRMDKLKKESLTLEENLLSLLKNIR